MSRLVPMPTRGAAPPAVFVPKDIEPQTRFNHGAEPLDSLAYNPVYNYDAGIYQITMIGSKRCYIGSSKGLGGRLRRHAEKLVEGKHRNVKLQRAWNEHGSHMFGYRIIEQGLTEAQLAEREQYWIDHHRAADVGFNILPTVGRKKNEVPVPTVYARDSNQSFTAAWIGIAVTALGAVMFLFGLR